ncbi:SsgA family sporulation/cell division regulator [Amycolatopsis sp. K13G38]|uniref:SsgA family sporulation/cell division regulator n=1 Tax=Amycolatopsis acididurans TaxID=2724524 RepID=A0ABX1J7T8_9PSEU|nr:SsgA family sporulation/cell division regulator [Amycolatopsis acididurans]NKQ54415.1 SsgA family sporulation/cell division regulator [Amycolatopsis acididurans]
MRPRSLNIPLWAKLEVCSGAVIELRPVKVKFRYSVDDPYAVLLDFAVGAEQWVRWELARDLLTTGLSLPAGLGTVAAGAGDVLIGPDAERPWRFWITVSSPTGLARFSFRRRPVAAALAKTEALVPPGGESARIDWEREFALLAGGGAA